MNDQIPTSAAYPTRHAPNFNITPSDHGASAYTKQPFCTGINPLILASRNILETISLLQNNNEEQAWSELQQEVIQNVKAFTVRATQDGYPNEVILIARYVLCATLDEILLYNPAFGEDAWLPYCLLDTFPVEHLSQEQFFLALERLCENPERYIDTLELIYLCLNLGFEGHYRAVVRGQEQLGRITNSLYQVIVAQRGEPELILSAHSASPYKIKSVQFQTPIKLWQGLVVTALLLGAIYGGFSYAYYNAEQPLVHSLQLLNQPAQQGNSSS